jgi:hypothetical protein
LTFSAKVMLVGCNVAVDASLAVSMGCFDGCEDKNMLGASLPTRRGRLRGRFASLVGVLLVEICIERNNYVVLREGN